MMRAINTPGGVAHVRESGEGPAVLFINSLGTDLRVWDAVLPLLAPGLRLIRYDKRGHGLSEGAGRGWSMGDLVADAAAVMDALGARDAVVVGLSIGGLIGQGLAAERPELARGLVLCDTAAKIGAPDMWDDRIRAIDAEGLAAHAPAILERWFTAPFRATPDAQIWRAMLERTTLDGYLGACAAIRDTDLRESTSLLRIPAMGICGADDAATPPDLVRETMDLIPGSTFHVIPRCGHLPPAEKPAETAAHLTNFLKGTGHV